ncbi:hypothetical protein [Aliamphritea ceti]|uniref:hypothetical protein n=1 Tax=Aliamphritea ceti TaxID=1524258 RepID=UPI0021C4B88E|nr:hypothetical protein [Aliamphritea ceti]
MLLITVLAGITEKVNGYFSDRINAQRLEYLDDHLLRDIGLAREFGRIVSYDFRDDELSQSRNKTAFEDVSEDSGG